jgi:predicted outer membrane repeat protein
VGNNALVQAGPQQATTDLGAATPRDGVGYGGAMYLTGSLTAVFQRGTNVSFQGNRAVAEGGAIHCAFCSSLYVTDVTFARNAAAAGGAICMDRVSLSSLINNNRFVRNAATCPVVLQPSDTTAVSTAAVGEGANGYTCGCGGGGAMCIRSASSVELNGSAFLNNAGYAGGALLLSCMCLCVPKVTCTTDLPPPGLSLQCNTSGQVIATTAQSIC